MPISTASLHGCKLQKKNQRGNHGIATVVSPPPSKHHHGITSTVDTPCFLTPWFEPLRAQNLQLLPWRYVHGRVALALSLELAGMALSALQSRHQSHHGRSTTASPLAWIHGQLPGWTPWLKSIWLRHHAGVTMASPPRLTHGCLKMLKWLPWHCYHGITSTTMASPPWWTDTPWCF